MIDTVLQTKRIRIKGLQLTIYVINCFSKNGEMNAVCKTERSKIIARNREDRERRPQYAFDETTSNHLRHQRNITTLFKCFSDGIRALVYSITISLGNKILRHSRAERRQSQHAQTQLQEHMQTLSGEPHRSKEERKPHRAEVR